MSVLGQRSDHHSSIDDLQSALSVAPVAMFLTNLNGECTFANPELCSFTGRTPEEFAGDRWHEMIHPEDLARTQERWQAAYIAGTDLDEEIRIVRKNGATAWVLARARVRLGLHGEPVGYIGTLIDLTARRKAEEVASRHRAVTGLLFEHSPFGIQLFSYDGTSLAMNETQRKSIGLPTAETGTGRYNLLEDPDIADSELFEGFLLAREGEVVEIPRWEVDRGIWSERWDAQPGHRVLDITLFSMPGRDGQPGSVCLFSRDVSDQATAEEKLREAELRFRLLFELTYDAIGIRDGEGRLTTVNSSFRELFGLSESDDSAEIALGDLFADLQDRDTIIANIQEHGRTSHTYRIRRLDGSFRDVESNFIQLPGGNGKGFIGIAHDITERVAAEQLLRASERRFRAVFEGALDAISIRARGGKILAANKAFRDMFAIGDDVDMESIPQGTLIVEGELDQIRKELAETGRCHRVYKARRLDGTIFDAEGKISLINFDDGSAQVIGVYRDVTAVLAQQRALALAEENFRTALDSAAEAVAIFDEDDNGEYKISYCNPRLADLVGMPAEHIIGRDHTIFLTPREVAAGILPQPQGDGTSALDVVRRFADGEHTLSIRTLETRNPETGRGRVIGTARDVTAVRKADAQANELRRLQSLSHMAGGVAHDFNNALQAIIVGIDIAMMLADEDWEGREVLTDARSAAGKAALVARDMLNFSGSGKLAERDVVLADLVAEVVHNHANTAARRDIDIDVERDLEPLQIRGDRDHLKDALNQLVLNAIESIDANAGGRVWIRTGEIQADRPIFTGGHITPDLDPGHYAYIEVADNGEGMAPDVREHIFDPFFTTRFVGRGMGLPAALGVIRAHHGTIIVDTEQGRGSTFRIMLPLNAAEGALAA